MKKLTDAEQRQINFELLCYFDEMCRKNHIHYSLTGGTLLGAVRHKGFIPWDDDVDVFLVRPEFEKLDTIFPEHHRFIWKSRSKEPGYEYVFGRLIDTKTVILDAGGMPSEGNGLFLDVCVVDGVPDQKMLRKWHIFLMKLIYRGRRSVVYDVHQTEYFEKGALIRGIKSFLRKTTSLEFWQRLMEKEMKRYPFDGGKFVGNFTSQYGARELMHRSSWDSYVELEFEGRRFEACVGWEEYLKNIYGDYMQLPPKDKQKGHHIGVVYWREEDCRE